MKAANQTAARHSLTQPNHTSQEFSKLLDSTSISPLIQRTLSFAAYWKNPYNYSSYLEDNIFLADINNERVHSAQRMQWQACSNRPTPFSGCQECDLQGSH